VIKTFCWNVNGIRACSKNGFEKVLNKYAPDIIGLQEVRASEDQIPNDIKNHHLYPHQYYVSAQKKGYSGVGILSQKAALEIHKGLGIEDFDCEGRVITARFEKLIYISAYFPNSRDGGKRISYKIDFCQALHKFLEKLSLQYPQTPIVLAGDYNIAHEEIDLARPDDNHDSAGFLPDERKWMSSFLEAGWVDTYRSLHPKTVKYSWWSARTRARERNIGWRIDYHTLKNTFQNQIKEAGILDNVLGSDHCPVTLTLDI